MASGTADFGKDCVTVVVGVRQQDAFLIFLGLQCVVPAASCSR